MTNEETIVVLQKIKPIPHRGDSKSTTHILETIALDMAIKALKQKWIPVSERLPEDGDTYLVTIEYNGEVIGVDAASYSPVDGYINKHWDTFNDWKEDDDSCYHVTAWMPLPEGYNAEE